MIHKAVYEMNKSYSQNISDVLTKYMKNNNYPTAAVYWGFNSELQP